MIYKDMDKDIIMLRREDGSCIRLCDDRLLRENEKLRDALKSIVEYDLESIYDYVGEGYFRLQNIAKDVLKELDNGN